MKQYQFILTELSALVIIYKVYLNIHKLQYTTSGRCVFSIY